VESHSSQGILSWLLHYSWLPRIVTRLITLIGEPNHRQAFRERLIYNVICPFRDAHSWYRTTTENADMTNTNEGSSVPTIALLDDYHNRAHTFADWSGQTFANIEYFSEPFLNEAAVVKALQHVKGVGLMRERTPFPATTIEQLPNLELIVTSGKKNASIDVNAAAANGVTVCGTESPGHATAELAFLLLMSLSRQFVPLVNALSQDNNWQPVMGRDLRGQTLGILGLGRLGGQLAGFANAMGMRVIAWSENLQERQCTEQNVEYVSRADLFKQADAVSIHLRHSARTDALVNAQDLALLGEHGYLINTSRAEIVDRDALKHALDKQVIAGIATDVFEQEPTAANDWIVQHPRVLATPHIGYCTHETFTVFYGQMLEAFQAYYAGSPIRVISPS